jgi:AraC-like DNA-binding protein
VVGIDPLTPHIDDLSAALNEVRVRSVVYCRSELGAPWGFRVCESRQAKFHMVLKGPATLITDNADVTDLKAGDLVLLLRGSGHVMTDRGTSRVRRLEEILASHPVDAAGTMHYGGRGPKTLLVCGAFDTGSTVPLLDWVPPVLVLDTATNGLGRWIDPMTDLVRSEARSAPGDAAVIAKVADVFLTDALRQYLATSQGPFAVTGFRAGCDPSVAEAMALMHNRCNEPWTIEALARQVGMSRSSFAMRFRTAVGSAPIAYLTRVRLARAAGALTTSTRTLVQIARAAGYDNESSFSKAFVRHYGQPPGQYRWRHRQTFGPAEREER